MYSRDFSSLKLNRFSENAAPGRLQSPIVIANKTSSLDKDPRQLEEEATISGVENRCYIDSQPSSNVTDDSFGTSEMEGASKGKVLQRYGKKVGSGQMSSLKVAKKKR